MASDDVYVHGGDDICDAVLRVVGLAEAVVNEEAAEQLRQQHARLVGRAQVHPRWVDLAGDITMWHDDKGNPTFGVPGDSERYDQAVRAEFGDDKHEPAPLIRMGLASDVADIGWSMTEAFMRRGF